MNVFPQLSSGAVTQFPFQREARFRTLVTEALDGSEYRVSDMDFQSRQWRLMGRDLTDAEWQAIEDLFVQVEGRLQSFLFLEPGASLLSWSEKFDEPQWQTDSGISVNGSQPDPFGGTRAGRVTSAGAPGALFQTLDIPASFRYAGSVWARTTATGAKLRVDDGAAQAVEAAVHSDNQWKRYSVSYNLVSAAETVRFRVVVPTGAAVDIYGPQLEAQPAPSIYKKTFKQAGVYPNARFDQDMLADHMTDDGLHQGPIRITWTPLQT
jgi:hypothetical protein